MKLTRIKITNQTSNDVFCIFSTSVLKKTHKINNMTTTYSRLCATLQWLLHFKRAHLSYYYWITYFLVTKIANKAFRYFTFGPPPRANSFPASSCFRFRLIKDPSTGRRHQQWEEQRYGPFFLIVPFAFINVFVVVLFIMIIIFIIISPLFSSLVIFFRRLSLFFFLLLLCDLLPKQHSRMTEHSTLPLELLVSTSKAYLCIHPW